MTHEQILTKAIEKANAHGFDLQIYHKDLASTWYGLPVSYSLIFNHDFAKALWGDEMTCLLDGERMDVEAPCNEHGFKHPTDYWQYHLMQMVVSEDPIAYLGEHLE